MTFFSDNPAIISLSNDKNFRSYFKTHELVSLTNFGTAFGMGLIVITFMTGFGYFNAAMIGLAGALAGAVVSTRLMQRLIKNEAVLDDGVMVKETHENISFRSEGSTFLRFLNAILDGVSKG
jgi:hypothetical protein